MLEKELKENAEKVNRAEMAVSQECITMTKEIIGKAVMLAREINQKLCSREIDSNDRRLREARAAMQHVQDVIESLSLVIAYDITTISINRLYLEED